MANESLKKENKFDLALEHETTTPVAWAQQVRKYKLGLFVTGIIGVAFAAIDFMLIAMLLYKYPHGNPGGGLDPVYTVISKIITSLTILFVIILAIDVVLTINLNRYVKNKKALILYIPCLSSMVCFSVPQILGLLKLFNIDIPIEFMNVWWANYVNIAVCGIFMITEFIRLIKHRDELNIKAEIYKALR